MAFPGPPRWQPGGRAPMRGTGRCSLLAGSGNGGRPPSPSNVCRPSLGAAEGSSEVQDGKGPNYSRMSGQCRPGAVQGRVQETRHGTSRASRFVAHRVVALRSVQPGFSGPLSKNYGQHTHGSSPRFRTKSNCTDDAATTERPAGRSCAHLSVVGVALEAKRSAPRRETSTWHEMLPA